MIADYYIGVSGASLGVRSFRVPQENPKDEFHMRVSEYCVPFSIRRIEVSEHETCK